MFSEQILGKIEYRASVIPPTGRCDSRGHIGELERLARACAGWVLVSGNRTRLVTISRLLCRKDMEAQLSNQTERPRPTWYLSCYGRYEVCSSCLVFIHLGAVALSCHSEPGRRGRQWQLNIATVEGTAAHSATHWRAPVLGRMRPELNTTSTLHTQQTPDSTPKTKTGLVARVRRPASPCIQQLEMASGER